MNRPALPDSGRCEECGFDAGTLDNDALVETIAAFSLDGLQLSETRPSPDVWSPREYAWHMQDAFDFYQERIEMVLRTDRPRFTARDFSVAPAPRTAALDAKRLVARLRTRTPEQWRRIAVGSSGGERDVRNLVARLAHECVHHTCDIDRGMRAVGS